MHISDKTCVDIGNGSSNLMGDIFSDLWCWYLWHCLMNSLIVTLLLSLSFFVTPERKASSLFQWFWFWCEGVTFSVAMWTLLVIKYVAYFCLCYSIHTSNWLEIWLADMTSEVRSGGFNCIVEERPWISDCRSLVTRL